MRGLFGAVELRHIAPPSAVSALAAIMGAVAFEFLEFRNRHG